MLLLALACAPDLSEPDTVVDVQAAALAYALRGDGWVGESTVCVDVREGDADALIAALREMNYPVDGSDACVDGPTPEGSNCYGPVQDAQTGEAATRWTVGPPEAGEDETVEVRVGEHHCDLWAAGYLCTLRHDWRGWAVEQCFQEFIA